MLERIEELPQQCRDAWAQVMAFPLPESLGRVEKVVILGMGGSAIGGDLLRGAVSAECPAPILVVRDYQVPALVDSKTLVIGSSYSGETEETLAAFEEAAARGAQLLAITTGGRLQALAASQGIPLLTIRYTAQPRAALGYSFISLLGILHRIGLIADRSQEVAEMASALEGLGRRLGANTPLAQNPAKQLAQRLEGRLAVIYGGGILSEVARRWKGQINENGKSWAFYELFPELNHNAIVGYDFPQEMARRILVVLLYSDHLHPRTQLRYRITQDILAQKGVECQVVRAEGRTGLSQMMTCLLFGDYVSYYLALLNGVDPSPVEIVSFLKQKLAEGSSDID
jgi:glucose/mannose-6-phosphate isomerase